MNYLKLLTLAATLLLSPNPSWAETVHLANGEWPPFQSNSLKHGGFISHVVSAAFEEEGIEVQFSYQPWKRGYQQAKHGRLDGTFVWSKTPQREKEFYYSDVVIALSTVVFHQAGKEVSWNKIEDLKQYRIGGVIGYDYGLKQLEQSGTINILREKDLEVILAMLAKNRLDIVLADADVGLYTLKKTGLENKIVLSNKSIDTDKRFYLLVSKQIENGNEITQTFNTGLKKLKQSGRYDEFLRASRNGEYLLQGRKAD